MLRVHGAKEQLYILLAGMGDAATPQTEKVDTGQETAGTTLDRCRRGDGAGAG